MDLKLNLSEANQQLISTFYCAFQKRDGETMASCYAPDASFEDAVFKLEGARIGEMWKMLCLSGKDLKIQFGEITATEKQGSARWVAEYTFSATGRRVKNEISAHFTFENGKIKTHKDQFSFWKWSGQALGPLGMLLGWTRTVQKKVQVLAYKNLEQFSRSQKNPI